MCCLFNEPILLYIFSFIEQKVHSLSLSIWSVNRNGFVPLTCCHTWDFVCRSISVIKCTFKFTPRSMKSKSIRWTTMVIQRGLRSLSSTTARRCCTAKQSRFWLTGQLNWKLSISLSTENRFPEQIDCRRRWSVFNWTTWPPFCYK